MSFFCGGSRNFGSFIDLFDGVLVLVIDQETLKRRLAERPFHEFGGRPVERDLILHLHAAGAGVPKTGAAIDATAPLDRVVEEILARCGSQIVRRT